MPAPPRGCWVDSATRSARWASWADSLKMVFDRHPEIAGRIVRGLEDQHPAPSIQGVLDCGASLTRQGFHPPSRARTLETSLSHANRERDGEEGNRV